MYIYCQDPNPSLRYIHMHFPLLSSSWFFMYNLNTQEGNDRYSLIPRSDPPMIIRKQEWLRYDLVYTCTVWTPASVDED